MRTMVVPLLLCLACGDGGEQGRMVGMTAAHNAIRAEVDDPAPDPALPELKWSDEIAEVAEEYATELADKGCPLVHSGKRQYGENLAWFQGFDPDAEEVARQWATEKNCYGYGRFMAGDSCSADCSDSGGCGHYTQIIWRDTRKLGCGRASCGGQEIWVCNYSPPGNYLGEPPY